MVVFVLITLLAQADPPEKLEWPKPPTEKIDELTAMRGNAVWDLEWSDAEDRVHGTFQPLDPIAERPLTLSLMVGTFQGAEFDGPVTVSMRCDEWQDSRTVRRAKGERAWTVTFLPQGSGTCGIDVSFTTTRRKLLHLKTAVDPAPLSRVPWFVILGALVIAAFGFGIRAVFRGQEPA